MENIKEINVDGHSSFIISTNGRRFKFTIDELGNLDNDQSIVESKTTIVTGLWNINRSELSEEFQRSYEHYKQKFTELLKSPVNMVIYVDESDVDFIWKHRSPTNTLIKVMETEEFKTWFEYYDTVQNIRTNSEWKSQAGWLPDSPQARLPYYNPIVMSKMFLLNNATLYNPFNSEYFYWIDAGITNTVHPGYFSHDKVFDNLHEYTDHVSSFIFLSYPYEGGTEIHGFPRKEISQYCGVSDVKYVCRGGFFGGTKSQINDMNGLYYNILAETLSNNLMGTEESLFTILAHRHPDLIHKFELAMDGLVWPFFEKLKNVKQLISETYKKLTYNTAKNNIYILSLNSPFQFESVCKSIIDADKLMFEKSRKILINNSIDHSVFSEYDRLCNLYQFEQLKTENLGVCGGRQFAAEHFDKSDADFYMFFEDDMHLNGLDKINETCKCGLTKYVPNIYNKVLSIMIKEKFDFLKFSFSEFYGDNSIQWAWYNVPQSVRTEYWPEYDKLPEIGLDPNAPRTIFKNINIIDGTAYVNGEIYYSNWPQIVSREGNKKMFLDMRWDYPYEQTWMSHIYQLTKRGELTSAILLASPVTHDRFEHYDGTLRKES